MSTPTVEPGRTVPFPIPPEIVHKPNILDLPTTSGALEAGFRQSLLDREGPEDEEPGEDLETTVLDGEPDAEQVALVGNDEQAERHLRAVAFWREEQERKVRHAQKEIERVKTWLEGEVARIGRHVAWHETGLRAYLVASGRKSLRLIRGTIRFLAGRERVEVPEPEKFLTWAKSNAPALIRVKEEADKQAIARYVKTHGGEIPEGCDLVKGEDTFKVELVEAPEGKEG